MTDNYCVKQVLDAFGVFRNCRLILICSSKRNAHLICDVLKKDIDNYERKSNMMYELTDFRRFLDSYGDK